ncbi:unnamed protein product, partial [Fusarium graminearum]
FTIDLCIIYDLPPSDTDYLLISTITHSPVCNIPSPYPPEEQVNDKHAPIAETILYLNQDPFFFFFLLLHISMLIQYYRPSSCLSMNASASLGKSV